MLASALWPLSRLGSEFMPPLYEGDLLYMPTTLPGVSVDEAAQILQVTDRLIRQRPEVARVFGKAGRADSATDPAPLSMLETTILLRSEEHTSELQSLMRISYAVFCLKTKNHTPTYTRHSNPQTTKQYT